MIIKGKAKNGVVTHAIKTYDELNEKEKNKLIFPAGDKKEIYADYAVHYNKHNELIRVVTNSFTSQYSAELQIKQAQPNIIDYYTAALGKGKDKKRAIDKFKETPIKYFLKENNSSIAQVARKTGISATTLYSASLKEVTKTSVTVIKAIADTVDKSPGDVLDELLIIENNYNEVM
ncbi:hypothetical protein CNY62_02365 [Brochothrix thermosphacta]|uniref:HTH cro/C1-type domain-containing protein n=1 Tax=Brochothrix thermosphacta TaxID=2756 RepID=A0A291BVS1_BROTH|nr:helix-turn-helix domain-containing protein [Brochothrix thermosphacta]ATF25328.1 hypothetical protein CNY62_02365 [Brochothrix thermosphacta]